MKSFFENAVILVFCYDKPNMQYLIKSVLYHSSTSSQFSFESVMVLSRIKNNGTGDHFYQQNNFVVTFSYLGGLGRISWKEYEAPFVRVVSFSEI